MNIRREKRREYVVIYKRESFLDDVRESRRRAGENRMGACTGFMGFSGRWAVCARLTTGKVLRSRR
jgi:hypothetical protein